MQFPAQELSSSWKQKGKVLPIRWSPVSPVFLSVVGRGASSIACFVVYISGGLIALQVEMFLPESDCRSLYSYFRLNRKPGRKTSFLESPWALKELVIEFNKSHSGEENILCAPAEEAAVGREFNKAVLGIELPASLSSRNLPPFKYVAITSLLFANLSLL